MTPSPLSSAAHADAMREYAIERQQAATRLRARGPLDLDTDGRLAPEILRAYRTHGFYVFENVVTPGEISQLRRAVNDVIDRARLDPNPNSTCRGGQRSAETTPSSRSCWRSHCRIRGAAPRCLPAAIRRRWQSHRRLRRPGVHRSPDLRHVHVDAGGPSPLRAPGLLAVAASINGDDFVPYNDAIFVKKPGLGASVGWHQDGDALGQPGVACRHPRLQLPGATSCDHCANALWVVPGSHHHGKADIKAMVAANGGSDMLPDAVPLVCGAGDVTIANRQIVHGSFANSSPDPRVSITFDSTSEPPCSGSPASSGWPLLTPRSRLRRGANPGASSNHPGCHRCPLSAPAGRGTLRVLSRSPTLPTTTGTRARRSIGS